MAQKKTNIKIKRKKFNLYNKKKSKARQALTIILTIAAACALGVVGYGVGKPVLDYFQNRGQYTSDGSSSSESSDMSAGVSGGAESSELSESSESAESSGNSAVSESGGESAQAPVPDDGTMYFLPENAAASSASLNSALAAAKSTGHTTVVVTLKDASGNFYYKTNIAAAKTAESIKGTLTAAQIYDIIAKAGFSPAARISTLMDSSNPGATGGSYELAGEAGYWLDNRKEKGGKTWLSPFKNATATFLKSVVDEIAAAGFKNIICANTRYPVFHNVDITTYLKDLPLNDAAKRTAALWSVIDAVNASAAGKGARLWIEIGAEGLLAESASCTDAEICSDKAKMSASNIIFSYTASGNASDAYKNAKEFAVKAKAAANGAEFAVLIKGFSGSALSDVQRAF
ncbi:MAG: hypothetical protein NC299_07595, partial [Lachnospiraceae bacterium]|nr:hypothetical protein [Ruminococcus sp.]MCM1275217.1 hypothetical protein [Lachnospiraceae bacterium]